MKAIFKSNTDWDSLIQKSSFHDFLMSVGEKEILLKSDSVEILAVKSQDAFIHYNTPEYDDFYKKLTNKYSRRGFRLSVGYGSLRFFRKLATKQEE